MDLIDDLAYLVPSRIVCRIMGVPDEDLEILSQWTAARTNAFFAKLPPEDAIALLARAAIAGFAARTKRLRIEAGQTQWSPGSCGGS